MGGSANASEGDQPCVPSDAYDEVIHHDAVTHEETVVDSQEVPEVWANFSPDHQEGPFEGPPAYPTDERGTWHIHDKIPAGHEGPDGVYQRDNPGNGNGDWFYRQNYQAEVSHTVTIVDQEAYDEVIHHDAVTCEGPQPPPIVTTQHIEHHYCGNAYYSADDITTTIEWILVDGEWVQGEPVVEDNFSTWVEQNPKPCPTHPHHNPPHHAPPALAPPVKQSVPTVIEAGL